MAIDLPAPPVKLGGFPFPKFVGKFLKSIHKLLTIRRNVSEFKGR